MLPNLGARRRLRVTSDSAALVTGSVIVSGVMISANGGNVDCEILDQLTDTSSDDLTFHVLDGETKLWDFTSFGGILFSLGITVDTTANAVIQIFVS